MTTSDRFTAREHYAANEAARRILYKLVLQVENEFAFDSLMEAIYYLNHGEYSWARNHREG